MNYLAMISVSIVAGGELASVHTAHGFRFAITFCLRVHYTLADSVCLHTSICMQNRDQSGMASRKRRDFEQPWNWITDDSFHSICAYDRGVEIDFDSLLFNRHRLLDAGVRLPDASWTFERVRWMHK